MNWSGNFREGLAREIRENKTLAKITAYTVHDNESLGCDVHLAFKERKKTQRSTESFSNYDLQST